LIFLIGEFIPEPLPPKRGSGQAPLLFFLKYGGAGKPKLLQSPLHFFFQGKEGSLEQMKQFSLMLDEKFNKKRFLNKAVSTKNTFRFKI